MIDLEAIRELPSVANAMEQLRSLSHRPLEIKHTSQWVATGPTDPPFLHCAAYVRTDDRDEIYLNNILPEHMAVHELIHPILWAEGYPDVRLVKRPGLRYTQQHEEHFEAHIDGIRDSLEHHEVHRRMMGVFGLDMAPYYTHKAKEHSAQLDEIVATVSREIPFVIQKEIIDVLEMLEYKEYFGKSLDAYRKATPMAYSSCELLFGKVGPVGFATPKDALACYEMIRNFIVAFGSRIGMSESENDLWRGLDFPLEPHDHGSAKESYGE